MRQVNNLCDNALIAAYGAGIRNVERRLVEEVADNLDMLPSELYTGIGETLLQTTARAFDPIGQDELIDAENRELLQRGEPNEASEKAM